MISLLLAFSVFINLSYLTLLIRHLRKLKYCSLTHISVITVTSLVCTPVSIMYLFGITNYGMFVASSHAVMSAVISNLIFVFSSIPFVISVYRIRMNVAFIDSIVFDPMKLRIVAAGLSLLLLVVFVYSYGYHGNYSYLPQIKAMFFTESVGEHYDLRQIKRGLRGGFYAAEIGFVYVAPLLLGILAVLNRQSRVKVLSVYMLGVGVIYLLLILLSFQRSPIVTGFATFVGCFLLSIQSSFSRKYFKIIIIAIVLSCSSLAIAIYLYSSTWAGGNPLLDAFLALLNRVFVVPSATPLYMYEAFPALLEYRGLLGSFMMGVYTQGTSIGFADVSYTLFGVEYSPNTNYIAVAYSGIGYFGVLTVSVFVHISSSFYDRVTLRMNRIYQYLSYFVMFIGIVSTISAPLLTSMRNFGFITCGMMFILILRACRVG